MSMFLERRIRTRSTALLAALLIALVAAGFAAASSHPGPAATLPSQAAPRAVDALEAAALAGDDHAPDENVPEDRGAQGEHGAAVSAVANDVTLVGGDHDNHGGAVSLVARGDNGPPDVEGQSADHRQDGDHRP